MPPDFPTDLPSDFPTGWVLGIFAVVVAIPLGRWLLSTIGKQIAVEILDYLKPSIQQVARSEIEAVVDSKLQPLYDRVGENGGSSLHDRLSKIETTMHTWGVNQASQAERFDPPKGHPA